MNSNGKIIISLDFDGTIVPSTPSGFHKMQECLNMRGLPSISEADLQKVWGKKFTDVVRFILKKVGVPDYQLDEEIAAFLEIEKSITETVSISEEMVILLQKIKDSKHLTALITSRNKQDLEHGVKDFGVSLDYFDYIQTSDQSEYHKPDGRVFNPLFKWAEEKGVEHKNIIYCGDTLYDWGAAVSAKPPIQFIGVVSGVATASDFFAAGVTEVARGPNGLAEYLDLKYLSNHT